MRHSPGGNGTSGCFVPPDHLIVVETEHWRLNQRADSALPGYLILEALDPRASRLADLPPPARAELGTLLARAETALVEVLGAQKVQVCRWGHSVGFPPHFHLIPVTDALLAAFPGDEPPDGPEIDLYVAREFCEAAVPPDLPGPHVDEVVARLRDCLRRE